MLDWMLANYLKRCQFLSDAFQDITWGQWRAVAAQSRIGITLWHALFEVSSQVGSASEEKGEVAKPEVASPPTKLETETLERLKSGLAPPREIYDVRNRGRIDWSKVPDWAKPPDPEMFEGGHEG